MEELTYEKLLAMSEAELLKIKGNKRLLYEARQAVTLRVSQRGKGELYEETISEPNSELLPYYNRYINSAEWRTFRAAAISVAGGKCNRCGSRLRLNVHHKHYKTLGKESLDDVEVLCRDCHKKEHGK